jgi:nitrite reductase/ring-hydroxylating ferredoxin subunit
MDYFCAGPVSEFLATCTPIPLPLSQTRLTIVRTQSEYVALKNICPHQGAPLHDGAVVDIEDMGIVWGQAIVCAKHGWSFDLRTGQGGNSRFVVDVHHVKVQDEHLWVSLLPVNTDVPGPRRDFGGMEVP